MYSKNLNENLLSGMNQSCSKSFKRSLLWHILLMIWCHQKKNLISQEKKSTWVDLFCEETWLPPSWRNMAHKKKWPLPTPLFILHLCLFFVLLHVQYLFTTCSLFAHSLHGVLHLLGYIFLSPPPQPFIILFWIPFA